MRSEKQKSAQTGQGGHKTERKEIMKDRRHEKRTEKETTSERKYYEEE